jgi:osmotically-inducible protein OsmY
MKFQPCFPATGLAAVLAAVAIATGGPLIASPQLLPDEPSEVADFIQTDVGADPGMAGSDVKVQVEKNGIAIVSGTARSLAQADRATARAIASYGVRAVVNKVVVPAGSPSALAEEIKRAFKGQKMMDAGDVSPSVKAGRVILSGTVGTLDERDLAREIVSLVPGVVNVQNNLGVTFEGVRKDSQIEEQLRFLIKDDPLYAGLDLAVSVKEGIARISGEVGTKGEHDRLIRNSYVTGVVDVQIGDLTINRTLAMEGLGDKDYSAEESLTVLRDALAMDSRVDPAKVQPSLRDGMLTLKGSVRSQQDKDFIETTARAIPGVLHVTNLLNAEERPVLVSENHDLKLASPPVLKRRR